jgi:lipooligosaccharide transport system permease protein
MFLFSGTFFPVSQLPDWLEPVAWATPLWHGVELCRDLTSGDIELLPSVVHVGYLFALVAAGTLVAIRQHKQALLK